MPGLCLSVPMDSTDMTQPEHIHQGQAKSCGRSLISWSLPKAPCRDAWEPVGDHNPLTQLPQMCLILAVMVLAGPSHCPVVSLFRECGTALLLSAPAPALLAPLLGCRLTFLVEPPAFATPSLWLTAILPGKVNKTLHIRLLKPENKIKFSQSF